MEEADGAASRMRVFQSRCVLCKCSPGRGKVKRSGCLCTLETRDSTARCAAPASARLVTRIVQTLQFCGANVRQGHSRAASSPEQQFWHGSRNTGESADSVRTHPEADKPTDNPGKEE